MYLDHLEEIAAHDVAVLLEKEKSYGDSWKRRGGVGAFMMLARKWDRLETALNPERSTGDPREAPLAQTVHAPIPAYDIFTAMLADTRLEGIVDDIQDLRRYLLLVEAEVRARLHEAEKNKVHSDLTDVQSRVSVGTAVTGFASTMDHREAGGD